MTHEEVAKEESNSGSVAKIKLTGSLSEIKKSKKDLIDLVGLEVVENMYKDKVKYDKYRLKMLREWLRMRQRLDTLHQTEEDLELDLSKPLELWRRRQKSLLTLSGSSKGKKAMNHEEVAEEESDSGSVAKIRLTGSLVETLKQKPLKKFTYVNEKVNVAKPEIKKGKKDFIDLVGLEVVENMYKDKGEGPITMKVYRDDGLEEIIHNFKYSDLHLGEWKEVIDAYPKRTRAG
ncbi:hypothetical protein Tco_1530544 [Tanacetum coccineum]